MEKPRVSESRIASLAAIFAEVAADVLPASVLTAQTAFDVASALIDLQDLRRTLREIEAILRAGQKPEAGRNTSC